MNHKERFLKACRRQPTDCTPVWFMRQAGRYMPEYRRLREKHGLLTMFKTPEIAAEVTLQPVRSFSIDAAIIFADILLPLEGMGLRIEFAQGEGPVIDDPVRTRKDVERLRLACPEEDLGYVMRSLNLVSTELSDKVALIGFAGAPFTLASYMIEGGGSRNYVLTKKFMYEEKETWDLLMTKLVETLTGYLLEQVKAGAQVVQLFDSWAGCLSPGDYRDFVLPHTARIFAALKERGVPSIHFGTGTADLLPLMSAAGGDVVGADWRTFLDEAWTRVGVAERGIQGNLDPVVLMAPWPAVEERAADILERAAGRPGHIFNLGHGILPNTPVDTVRRLADFVHEYSSKRAG